jgi:hypothetical protein
VKEFLSRMDIAYIDRNVSLNREARHEYVAKGYGILPVIEVGDTVILEYEGLPQLIEVLSAEGYL